MSSAPQTTHCLRATNLAVRTATHHRVSCRQTPGLRVSLHPNQECWGLAPGSSVTSKDLTRVCRAQPGGVSQSGHVMSGKADCRGRGGDLVIGVPDVDVAAVQVCQQPAMQQP